MTPSSTLERRGVRLEPDGSVVLDRQRIEPVPGPEEESQRARHARYHVANPTLSATLENPGRINAYEVFHTGPILERNGWRQSLTIDDRPLGAYPPHTRMHGRMMVETWEAPSCRLTVSTFCDSRRNALFQAYRLTSLDGHQHTLQASLRVGFLADQEESAYALHFDERLSAIVAILGRMRLEPEAEAAAEGMLSAIPARAAFLGADVPPEEWRVSDERAYLVYRLEAPAHEEATLCAVIAGGRERSGVEGTFREATQTWATSLAEAEKYGAWLGSRLQLEDSTLQGVFSAGLNTALSAYREDEESGFRGLLAGTDGRHEVVCTLPADAYWCSQALLPFRPEWVRDEILALARAVHEDGRLARSVRTLPHTAAQPADPQAGPYDRWPDACDSPSYFAMLVHDYLCWTGDRALLDQRDGERSIWEKVQACVDYLRRQDTNHDFLFEKRRAQPDWAFDVLRDDWVTYDLALHCQALKSAAEIAVLRGEEETARDFADWAMGAQRAINRTLWREGEGHYVDYVRSYDGFVEDHAAIDTVVAVLYGIGTEGQSHRHLEYLERVLETRHNDRQYYGDWGVMACYPFYKQRSDLVGRSAWAYSFHNGAAWPGWSGIYALAELLHRRPGWRYALERWWTYGLAQYWFTPTEYYAPPYDAPSVRQGAALYAWSAMPAAAMVLGGFGFWPNLAGEMVLRVPPWGDSRLNGVRLRGEVYDVEARAEVVTVYHEGEQIASSPRGMRIRLGREPVLVQMA